MTAFLEIGDLPLRVTSGNGKNIKSGDYVLVILNRALRGVDNPVIDAAIAHANSLDLSIVVYSELDLKEKHTTQRSGYFTLGAFKKLAISLQERGITCIQTLIPQDSQALASLAARSVAIYTDEDYTHWDRAKNERILAVSDRAVFLVDAARLVPTRQLPQGLKTTPEFRKAHGALREEYQASRKKVAAQDLTVKPLSQELPEESNFAEYDDSAIRDLVSDWQFDRDLSISEQHPPTQAEITARIATLKAEILKQYKWIRNNPALKYSTSQLSPYMHFGMISPHQLLEAVESAEIAKSYTWKFRDEFLTWREWSHYLAFYTPNLHQYQALPDRAIKTLAEHAPDERPELRNSEQIVSGDTPDPTWNAAQKEWLNTGWLHNNLRMYWSKQILRFTPDPETAWNTACDLNDWMSLDGKDPATYASMQWAFGNGKPGYSEKPIYGLVAPKSNRAILKREGMSDWIEARNNY